MSGGSNSTGDGYDAPFGLRVRFGRVPETLGGKVDPGNPVEIAEGGALVRFPGQWALLVEHGRDVTVEWEGDGDMPAWIVDSWAVNLAMLQRGHLCLHATLVEVGGRVLALGGASGAGKSTTAAALHLRGHPVLVDDVAVVDLRDGAPWVIPYRRASLLTVDTLHALGPGLDVGPIERQSGKASWSPHGGPVLPDAVRLRGIVILERVAADATFASEVVRGGARVPLVMVHAGRSWISPRVLGTRRYFEAVTTVCAETPVLHLRRPEGSWSADAVAAEIETFAGCG